MEKKLSYYKNVFSPPNYKDSFFLSFEGIEGSGKSTQLDNAKTFLESNGFRVIILREPGGTDFGEKLRGAILQSETKLSPVAEAHLFAASRAQLLTEVILKELQIEKTVVICDRYIDSSIAYQGVARELGIETILKIHSDYPLTTFPHKTFYLKISLETSLHRQKIRNNQKDYFESEKNIFHQKLIDGYEQAATFFSNRITIIDGEKNPDEVSTQIRESLKGLINNG